MNDEMKDYVIEAAEYAADDWISEFGFDCKVPTLSFLTYRFHIDNAEQGSMWPSEALDVYIDAAVGHYLDREAAGQEDYLERKASEYRGY